MLAARMGKSFRIENKEDAHCTCICTQPGTDAPTALQKQSTSIFIKAYRLNHIA